MLWPMMWEQIIINRWRIQILQKQIKMNKFLSRYTEAKRKWDPNNQLRINQLTIVKKECWGSKRTTLYQAKGPIREHKGLLLGSGPHSSEFSANSRSWWGPMWKLELSVQNIFFCSKEICNSLFFCQLWVNTAQ